MLQATTLVQPALDEQKPRFNALGQFAGP